MYVLTNTYPPKIADLTGGNKQEEVKQAIPGVEETRFYLENQSNNLQISSIDNNKVADLREQALKEIAKGAALNAARSSNKEWKPDGEY